MTTLAQAKNLSAISKAIPKGRDCDHAQTLAQIGRGNVLAISGGRVFTTPDSIILPVSNGYHVAVTLDYDDTYSVRRVFTRGGTVTVKGTKSGVYYDEVGEAAYRASCFRSDDFGDEEAS